jgi:putative ABC transport system ATP-binding protein
MIERPGVVELVGVDKSYRRGRIDLPIFSNLSLRIDAGSHVALMGPSGSGKTTLLNLVGGLDRPTAGRVMVDGEDIGRLSEGALARWRSRHLGFIFQFYNLMPNLTAAENVGLPLLLRKLGRREREERIRTALDVVGLGDRAKHRPRELSGGQQQRVAIARAIVSDPRILLADEPTGDLDRETSLEVLDLLTLLNREFGKTVIMVTHDELAARSAREVLHLDKGRFLPQGGI